MATEERGHNAGADISGKKVFVRTDINVLLGKTKEGLNGKKGRGKELGGRRRDHGKHQETEFELARCSRYITDTCIDRVELLAYLKPSHAPAFVCGERRHKISSKTTARRWILATTTTSYLARSKSGCHRCHNGGLVGFFWRF